MKWYILSSIFVTGVTGETAIVSIKENNVELSRETVITDMEAGSYYHDLANQRVYMWPADSDNPNSNSKIYMFYVWLGFCSDRADYAIQGESSIFYSPVIDLANTPAFSQTITELFTGDITNSFGEIKFNNPEWFYQNKDNYIWINSEVRILYGKVGALYSTYSTVQYSLIQNIGFSDTGASISMIDIRERLFTTIPPDRFLTSDFPYLPIGDNGIHFNARAVLVGEKWGITPNLINTIDFTYEISQVKFGFKTFPGIEAITAVYKDGVALSTPADYTPDLVNGQFTLSSSPGASLITCDAKGLKISRNFSISDWNGNYSQNVADITYFYLRLQGITDTYIDETGFLTLQSNKAGVECGDWVFQEVEFWDKLKELQTTGQFDLLPTADGKVEIIPYSISEAPDVQLTNEYYSNFQIGRGQKSILNRILLRYDRAPVLDISETGDGGSLADYKYYRRIQDSTGYKYQVVKGQNFKTIINNEGDAGNAANTMMSLYGEPFDVITFQMNQEAIAWPLLKKIGITRSIIIKGQEYIIYNQVPFILMGKSINWLGYISITARKDPATLKGLYWTDHNDEIITDQNDDGITT